MTKVNSKTCKRFTVVYTRASDGKVVVLNDLAAADEIEAREEFKAVYEGQYGKIAGITEQGFLHKQAPIFE